MYQFYSLNQILLNLFNILNIFHDNSLINIEVKIY